MSEIALENELSQPDVGSSSKPNSTITDNNDNDAKNDSEEEDNNYQLLLKSYENKKRFHKRYEQSG